MTLLAAATLYGCAQSEPFDVNVLLPDGGASGGMQGSGSGGDGSSSGGTQGSGSGGTGDVGSGGSLGAGGEFGTGGNGNGSGGFSATGGFKGSGGAFGTGGSASGGFTGTGGSTASGGRGGTIGTGGATGKGGAVGTGGFTGTGGVMGSGGTTGTGGASGTGGSAPTFTEIYNQILTVYCAGGSCHDPGSQSGVSFSTQSGGYSSVSRLVTPGNGAGSSLYKTLSSGAMPLGQAKLSSANLALVEAWINAGALNN